MLIYSMSTSVDGFIADREGGFDWTPPTEELFRFHTALVSELGGYLCGRRLYETMLVWETDPSLRDTELGAGFADVWCALPKVVVSRTLDSVQGNARLAEASVAEEVVAALDATEKDVSIGGAGDRARPRRRAAHFPPSGRRGWRHAVPATGHRCRPTGTGRDQDVRLARDLRALRACPRWVTDTRRQSWGRPSAQTAGTGRRSSTSTPSTENPPSRSRSASSFPRSRARSGAEWRASQKR